MNKRPHNWHRGSRHETGYGTAWDKLRLVVLRRDGYLCQCAMCKSTGRVRLAGEVDHIVPKAKGGTDALDNLQAIHHECHRIKSMLDHGYTPRWQVGLDGWPVCLEART
jgi:5-methylcytosine-specific restriction protein A